VHYITLHYIRGVDRKIAEFISNKQTNTQLYIFIRSEECGISAILGAYPVVPEVLMSELFPVSPVPHQ